VKVIVPEMPLVPVDAFPQLAVPLAVTVGMFLTDADALLARPTTSEPVPSARAAAPNMILRKRTICSS
jgi:hypothetical protein